jgi:hypothetical protein
VLRVVYHASKLMLVFDDSSQEQLALVGETRRCDAIAQLHIVYYLSILSEGVEPFLGRAVGLEDFNDNRNNAKN